MIVAGALGALIAFGLLLVVVGLRRQPLQPLSFLLDSDWREAREAKAQTKRRLSKDRIVELNHALGLKRLDDFAGPTFRHDLAVMGRSPEEHAINQLTLLGTCLAVPLVLGLTLTAVGAPPGQWIVAVLVVALAAGLFLPVHLVRLAAVERREEFRSVLSATLDLAAVLIAGGLAAETAVLRAIESGDGWAFQRLQATVSGPASRNQDIWPSLRLLGVNLGIIELEDVAGLLGAASAGGEVADQLVARAEQLRTKRLTNMESKANEASENLQLPVGLIVAGFMVFLVFPLFSALSTSLTP